MARNILVVGAPSVTGTEMSNLAMIEGPKLKTSLKSSKKKTL